MVNLAFYNTHSTFPLMMACHERTGTNYESFSCLLLHEISHVRIQKLFVYDVVTPP